MTKRRVINEPGTHHFVTFSTYQRRSFLSPDRPKEIVVETLQQCLVKQASGCTGFVVMPNHVHAVLYGNETFNISNFLKLWKKMSSYQIGQFYQEHMERYQTLCPVDCPVWQARFYDYNIDSVKKLNEKLDYMHANPVTAGLVDYSPQWLWSSARYYEQNIGVGVTLSYESS